MKLSVLLPELLQQYDFKLENEQEFSTLGLVVAEVKEPFCTFVDTEHALKDLHDGITMVITTPEIAPKLVKQGRGVCITEQPRVVFFRLHNALGQHKGYARARHATKIGKNCSISPLAVVAKENVIIGDNVVIEEFAVIRDNVTIGDNCVIHAGVKIGFNDFEYKKENGKLFTVAHYGGVMLGEEVELHPNTCVNKALYPWDNTVIGDRCKIDMLVQVSHGVKVGRDTMIVGLSGIGGRTEIGENSWIGYGCIIRNGVHVGNNARANMGAVVSRDVADGQAVTGNFAIDHDIFMENLKRAAKPTKERNE